MPSQRTYRVFVSYTGKDLAAHADVVAKVLRTLEHLAIDHRDSGSTGEPSVQWCMEQVDNADFLLVLVAHRYGWVPPVEEGGDGRRSITQLEVDRANTKGKIVLPYIIEDDAPWPGDQFEALTNPAILEDLKRFKSELRRGVAAFFTDPTSLDGPLSRDIPKAIARIEKATRPTIEDGVRSPERPPVTPWIYSADDPPTLAERMAGGLPKRILSLQSGGVRAAVMIGYLEKIERLLQVRYGEANFRLADYFDLIGGMGPGALMALELARRRSVRDAAETFKYVLTRGFRKKAIPFSGVLGPRYSSNNLSQVLDARFGDLSLADSAFTTGFALLTTSLVRTQPVVISNHPALVSELGPNANVALAAFASFAIPTYFRPAVVVVRGEEDALVEGEASVGPDPSLALLLLVSSPHFPFGWRIGQHRLCLTAIGFDTKTIVRNAASIGNGSALTLIGPLLDSLIQGAAYQTRMIMEALALEGPAGDTALLEQSSAVTYRRYAANFDPQALLQLGIPETRALQEANAEDFELFEQFTEVGRAAAERDVLATHFPAAFDVRAPLVASHSSTRTAEDRS
jgi:hypothetical protein